MNTVTKISVATALFGAVAVGALVPATAQAAGRPGAAATSLSASAPDLGSPLDAVGNERVPAIAPDGTRVYSTKDRIAPPRRAGAASDTRAAALSWLPARSAGSGVRIRTNPVNGTVLGLVPFRAYLWIWCARGGSDGRPWFWTTYDTGSRWITGWTSSEWIYPSPDAYVPPC